MSEICTKIVEEAISVQRAEIEVIKNKRGGGFTIDDAWPYVEAVNKMRAISGQSSSVIDLYVDSVNAHFKAIKDLAKTIPPEAEPFLERLQIPAVLEILYREDDSFRKSVEIFIKAVESSRMLFGIEAMSGLGGSVGRRQGSRGQILPPGSVKQVLKSMQNTEIQEEHRSALMAASSWLLDDLRGVGNVFFKKIESGAGLEEALDEEITQVKRLFEEPEKAQIDIADSQITDSLSPSPLSFDVGRYIEKYSSRVEDAVKEAMKDGVHYANILCISAFSVGSISTLSQSTLNMAKDDLAMAVLEAVAGVTEASLRGSADRFKSPDHPLVLAAGSAGCALEYMLEMDGFSVLDIIGLLRRRSTVDPPQRLISGGASDFYHLDFVDLIYNGWRYLDNTARKGKACTARGLPVPKVTWFDVDLSPLLDNDVLMNPQRYSNPASPCSARLSALMRLSDQPKLFNGAAISVIMANLLSTQKENAVAPADIYRYYVMGRLMDSSSDYCQRAKSA